ncbi:hypothetical protein [Bosea sp. TAF32]|uniref:hypothetical protein n=1 Tax=Bosea sp. TAF32 TaxID=3237482 RepID=UPI003F8D9C33
MRLIELFWKNDRGTVVADVAKAGAAIAFLSVIAANFMSSRIEPLDRERMAAVSLAASKRQPVDPLTTGSITKAAGDTRLDPCALPR